MPDAAMGSIGGERGTSGRTSGWYVFVLAWLVFAAAFFAFSKTMVVAPTDVTNYQVLEIADRYASYVGVALGLVTFLVTGLVYLVLRLFRVKALRIAALDVTALGYGVWLAFGYDLVYLEPRYAEVARAIITYLGKPMLYSAAIVCGGAVAGAALTFALGKRAK